MRFIQILCLSTLNLINQRNVSHIKLSKYCDIDVCVDYLMETQMSVYVVLPIINDRTLI